MVRYAAMGRVMHHNVINMIGMNGGFDGLWLDHEHVGFSMENLEIATAVARSQNLDCFVRIAPTDYALFTKCLEAGAGGVMAAMVYSAEQAEQIVRWTKFAPRGQRGLNVSGFDGRFTLTPLAKFTQEANEKNWVAIQIETLSSVECVDEIAAIDGVDLLFVGPSDLSQALGVTGDFMHPKCQEAIDKVVRHDWPGNVRELRNVVERAYSLSLTKTITADNVFFSDLGLDSRASADHFSPVSLAEMEKRHIEATLRFTKWVKREASRILDIERSTLDRKLAAYGINRPDDIV